MYELNYAAYYIFICKKISLFILIYSWFTEQSNTPELHVTEQDVPFCTTTDGRPTPEVGMTTDGHRLNVNQIAHNVSLGNANGYVFNVEASVSPESIPSLRKGVRLLCCSRVLSLDSLCSAPIELPYDGTLK